MRISSSSRASRGPASISRRSAPTRPTQSWRASSTRVSPRTARSLVALSPMAGAISMIASSVRPAAARSRDLLLLELGDAEQHLRALGEIGRAIGARVQQLGQIRPRLGLRQDLLERRLGLLVAPLRLGEDLLGEPARLLRPIEPAHRDAQRSAQQPEPLLGRDLARLRGAGFQPPREQPGQRAPLVGLGGQAFEIAGHLGVGRRQRVGARAPLERQRLRRQALLADAPRFLQKLQLLGDRRAARPSAPRAPGRPAPRTSPAGAATSAPSGRAGSAPSPPCGSAGRSPGSRS